MFFCSNANLTNRGREKAGNLKATIITRRTFANPESWILILEEYRTFILEWHCDKLENKFEKF